MLLQRKLMFHAQDAQAALGAGYGRLVDAYLLGQFGVVNTLPILPSLKLLKHWRVAHGEALCRLGIFSSSRLIHSPAYPHAKTVVAPCPMAGKG